MVQPLRPGTTATTRLLQTLALCCVRFQHSRLDYFSAARECAARATLNRGLGGFGHKLVAVDNEACMRPSPYLRL